MALQRAGRAVDGEALECGLPWTSASPRPGAASMTTASPPEDRSFAKTTRLRAHSRGPGGLSRSLGRGSAMPRERSAAAPLWKPPRWLP